MKKAGVIFIICVLLLSNLLFVSCSGSEKERVLGSARVFVTTGSGSKLLAEDEPLLFFDYNPLSANPTVRVDVSRTYQEFYGYGASLTHSSAYLLMQEGAEEERAELLEELFGVEGARLNFLRIPIGASDYIEGDTFFTCNDIPTDKDSDFGLEYFNIAKDEKIISVLKEILRINPFIKLMAVPWSAPAWMKDSESLTGDGSLKENCCSVYADYLLRFVKAYAEEGISLSYLSLVNEPNISGIAYPHMKIDGLQAAKVTKLLRQGLNEGGYKDVEIFAWEHNVDEHIDGYLTEFSSDVEAFSSVSGIALHGYGESCLYGSERLSETYPSKKLFITEITEHTGSRSFENNLIYAAHHVTLGPINTGVSVAAYWNLVLRSSCTPTPVKHSSGCYGVMDFNKTSTGFEYKKHSSYYAMAQISTFAYPIAGIYPKAYRVESESNELLASALLRADGVIIVALVNLSSYDSKTVDVIINGRAVTYTFLPHSLVTLVC